MRNEILRLENIRCEGNTRKIMFGNFHVGRGEISGLLGLHNSGVNDMGDIISGEAAKDSGQIFIDNTSMQFRLSKVNINDSHRLTIVSMVITNCTVFTLHNRNILLAARQK